ncbi:hypothetical protein AG1IA_04815 [Rhizoctonia solani AG-1 IA]|uniref:Uncharacterized protein n=1 Tax=Thanatephorus cucumeris (strain AG1-IA) TaxID=983506 RepID=L8WXQ3_THACA|nr:hypothetical protein AG1IA_04815 [Rhizoctonia solani AG-1 IA]
MSRLSYLSNALKRRIWYSIGHEQLKIPRHRYLPPPLGLEKVKLTRW